MSQGSMLTTRDRKPAHRSYARNVCESLDVQLLQVLFEYVFVFCKDSSDDDSADIDSLSW